MTYNEFIQNIIDTRGLYNIPDGEYYEVHHIIPKCMGGQPNSSTKKSRHENLIWLYPGEHYIAHKLLALENPEINGLLVAWNCLSHINREFITEEEYLLAKINHSTAISSENNFFYGKDHSGELNGNYGKKHPGLNSGDSNPMRTHPEALEKRSNTVKENGTFKLSNNPRARRVLCIETGEIFNTLVEAGIWADQLGNKQSNTLSTIKSKMTRYTQNGKDYNGYHFKYLEE